MKEASPHSQMTILGRMFILLAILIALFSGARTATKLASASWPQASARVLASDMVKRTGKRADWCIRLRYRYTVDGRAYDSRRLSTSHIGDEGCHPSQHIVKARLDRMRPGASIPIRYPPGEPGKAIVYVARLDVVDYLFGVVAAVLLAAGVATIRQGRAIQRAHDRRLSGEKAVSAGSAPPLH